MSVGRVTVERAAHRITRVRLDGVDVPHVRGVVMRQAANEAPIVTLELVALAEFVDLDKASRADPPDA